MRLESLPGVVLDQKYRIERQLGEGSMGAVFRAIHLGTTRPVAIKVIAPKLALKQEFGQRFKREAEAAGRLTHPNVVNVTDFGVTRTGDQELAYLVMEYLDGESLADYLKKNPKPPFDFLLDVMEQIGLALDASHAAGIVHRDLKPSNVWLEPNRRGGYNVKVLDFGIAKVTNPAQESVRTAADAIATLVMMPGENAAAAAGLAESSPIAVPSSLQTIAGSMLGTPAYMAPEQCTSLEVTGLADIYSMAVIAYEMLCGQAPFEAATLSELLRRQVQTAPPSPRERDAAIPQPLADTVLNGLDKDPARRPPTAGTFAARLRAASEGELVLIRKSKDVFHSHPRQFMGSLLVCLSPVLLALPLRIALRQAVNSGLPIGLATLALAIACVSFTFFGFQLFKAVCTCMLLDASERGEFRAARPLKKVAARLPGLTLTHLMSVFDLRPSSWWANILWPVVWAAEGRLGKAALARSRDLCRGMRMPSISLAVRPCAISLFSVLVMPFMMLLTDPTGAALPWLMKGVMAGTFFGTFVLIYPQIFGIMFLSFVASFPFLYWTALRSRNEGSEIELPPLGREIRGKSGAKGLRPATVLWVALPLVFIAVIFARASVSSTTQALAQASGDGRRATVLKLIDRGLGAEYSTGGGETALFDAVRNGDETLVAGLIARGASVNRKSRGGNSPLVLAASTANNEIGRLLLDHGAQVDITDHDGRTPLMLAAMRGNRPLIEMLLQHGAAPGKRDVYGKTAAAYAREEGYTDVVTLLGRQ